MSTSAAYTGSTAANSAVKAGVVAELTLAKSGSSPLSSISLSSDQRHGVVGGRELMKVIRLAPEGLSEIATLKTGRRKSAKLSMYDVSWCHHGGRVAASLSNGGVAIWDLQHLATDADVRGDDGGKIIGNHERSVNRLCWDPHDHGQLLSGSQDGLLKMWDIRTNKEAAVFKPKNGAVRDVQFSPIVKFNFAAVFDNGKLQIWDFRYHEQPFMKIVAHTKTTISVEWHHVIPWRLATGSHDRTVKIWDLDERAGTRWDRTASQRQKPAVMEQTLKPTLTLASPAPVSRAKWRPEHPNQIAMAQMPPMRGKDVAIQVMDVSDPSIPLVVVHGGDDQKNGFCWLDTPLLDLPPPVVAPSASRGGNSGGGGAEGIWGGMGVWQHMVSCSEVRCPRWQNYSQWSTAYQQGTVRVHSLAKSTLPRHNLGPAVMSVSARGEMGFSTHKSSHDPSSWCLYLDEQTQAAPGMFQEGNPKASKAVGANERRRSPSAHGMTPPPMITQAQRIARSVSVGESGIKGRRMSGGPTSSSPGATGSVPGGLAGAAMLPRSPVQLPKGQMTAAPIAPLKLGTGRPAVGFDGSSDPQSRGSRGNLTIYPVNDLPVAVDSVNWHRGRQGPTGPRWVRDKPVLTSGAHRGFGPQLTEALAMSYALRGHHVRVMCAHNVDVCLHMGLVEMAYTWRQISTMLAGVPGGLLPPLGQTTPDVDVAAIVAGFEGGAGDGGVGGRRQRGAGWAGGEEEDGAAAERRGGRRDDTMTVSEVLDLMDKHYAQEEQQKQQQQQQQQQQRPQPQPRLPQQVTARPAALQRASSPGRNRGTAAGGGGGGGGGSKAPPRRPPPFSNSLLHQSSASSNMTSASGTTACSESGNNTATTANMSLNHTSSGGSNLAGGLDQVYLWRLPTRAPRPETVDGESVETEPAWWEREEKWRGGSTPSSHAAAVGVGGGAVGDATSGRERLPDEITLHSVWPVVIKDWLEELCNQGDFYHVVAICEVVRSWYYGTGPGRDEDRGRERTELDGLCDINDAEGYWLSTTIPALQVRKWYVECIEKLRRLQLHGSATDIINHCDDVYIWQTHLQNTTIYTRCSECGTAHSSGPRCLKCTEMVSRCAVCGVPVRGAYLECPGCHHGGHFDHMMKWFENEKICPHTMCGHECRTGDFTTVA